MEYNLSLFTHGWNIANVSHYPSGQWDINLRHCYKRAIVFALKLCTTYSRVLNTTFFSIWWYWFECYSYYTSSTTKELQFTLVTTLPRYSYHAECVQYFWSHLTAKILIRHLVCITKIANVAKLTNVKKCTKTVKKSV